MDFFDSAEIDKSHVTTREGPTTCNQLWVEPKGESYGIALLQWLQPGANCNRAQMGQTNIRVDSSLQVMPY